MRGKAAVVTGGGGSIGSEICDRLATFGVGAADGDRELRAGAARGAGGAGGQGQRRGIGRSTGRIADIRDRERVIRLIKAFRPDIVFHAAALKHVPLLERDWDEGIKTNVFGSINVADAAVACGRGGDGDDLDRQGDRADLDAGRDQAARRDVLPGARRRSAGARAAGRGGRCG